MSLPRSRRAQHVAAPAAFAGALLLAIAACASELDGGVRFTLAPQDEPCASCHADAREDLLAARAHGGTRHGVGCTDCHLPHELDSQGRATGGGVAASCESCHPEVVAEFALPFRHPLGATVACTSCHAPHGGPIREARRHVRKEACVDCHRDLRGPFVFQHEGDDVQACLSCHVPHGSANRRLLTHATSDSLCFSCHEDLEIIHTQEPGSKFIHCLNCHTEVHGSNWNAELFR